MNPKLRVILIILAALCFAIALSYPILYLVQSRGSSTGMDSLSSIRQRALDSMQESGSPVPAATVFGEDHASETRVQETILPEITPFSPEDTHDLQNRTDAENSETDSSTVGTGDARLTTEPGVSSTGEDAEFQRETGEKRPDRSSVSEWPANESTSSQEIVSATASPSHPESAEPLPRTETPEPISEGSLQDPGIEKTHASINLKSLEMEWISQMSVMRDVFVASAALDNGLAEPEPEDSDQAIIEDEREQDLAADLMIGSLNGSLVSALDAEEWDTVSNQEKTLIRELSVIDESGTLMAATKSKATPKPRPVIVFTPSPKPTTTPDRRIHTDTVSPYPEKEKIELSESRILPELKEIYDINHDLVGWLTIPGTYVDYPVVQSAEKDEDYYLKHDFYGKYNKNGQLILDANCDPYTPSYHLIISGHHMLNGNMFGYLVRFYRKEYWEDRKILKFDNLMEHKEFVIFAAFYSADYDIDEEGFRYNVDIQYRREFDEWIAEVRANQLYDTGIDVEFGDEFITLTTCAANRKNGRFVCVARRIREGEKFE